MNQKFLKFDDFLMTDDVIDDVIFRPSLAYISRYIDFQV